MCPLWDRTRLKYSRACSNLRTLMDAQMSSTGFLLSALEERLFVCNRNHYWHKLVYRFTLIEKDHVKHHYMSRRQSEATGDLRNRRFMIYYTGIKQYSYFINFISIWNCRQGLNINCRMIRYCGNVLQNKKQWSIDVCWYQNKTLQ